MSMKVCELSRKYEVDYASYKDEVNRIEAQKKRLERKQARLVFPGWISGIVGPIAEVLCERLPGYRWEVLGPFGLCSETSVHFYKIGLTHEELWSEEGRKAGSIKSITFVPVDLAKGEIMIRDESKNTGEFKKETIGELNGMNHPNVSIPEGVDIEWLLMYVN